MRTCPAIAAAIVLAACGSPPEATDLIAEVDPLIGTGGLGFTMGAMAPGPTRPYGMIKPGPDTSSNGGGWGTFDHCAGYWWEDDEIRAFSQVRMSGTGVPDKGVVGLMPLASVPEGPIQERVWRSKFDHRNERAELGRYQVRLDPSGIEVTIAATERTALYRFEYPAGGEASLVLTLAHDLGGQTHDGSVQLEDDGHTVSGRIRHSGDLSGRFGGFTLFFVLKTDRAIETVDALNGPLRRQGTKTATGAAAGLLLGFGSASGGPVQVQLGVSYVDLEGARKNLEAEWVGFDLDRAYAESVEAWRPIFGRFELGGGTPRDRRIFAAALYHAFQMPTVFEDRDHRYLGFDGQIHDSGGAFTYYSDLSLWDTFRTLHPWMVLFFPKDQGDFARSLELMEQQSGHLPRWPLASGDTRSMVGSHGETMLVDSFVKGVRTFDAEGLFPRLYAAAMGEIDANGAKRSARECIARYQELGYCPVEGGGGAASLTLENAYNDWLLAQLARGLGKTSEAGVLEARAKSWEKIWDPELRVLRGRQVDGTFPLPFAEASFSEEDFIEGNARQWLTYVPHDLAGLASKMGGVDALIARLEEIFENARSTEKGVLPDLWYWHGNEPDIHAAYIFAELGRPDLTNAWAHWIMDARYADLPAGLDGNDDGGTLSAWFLFSALGFYPKVGTTRYVLGLPRVPYARITLPNDRQLEVIAEGLDAGRRSIERIELDDVVIDGPFVEHDALLAAEKLVFVLAD